MSSESAAPLRIEAGPSWRLAAFVWTVHAAVMLVCALLPLGLAWRLLLAGTIGASLLDALRTHVWRRGRRAIVAADALPGGTWVLHLHSGKELQAHLLGSSFAHPRLLVLNFRVGWLKRYSLVLTEDAADADLLRLLRMRLLWAGSGARPRTQ